MATRGPDIQIQAPELLTGPERARDTVITAAMWLVYLYLWVPLLSLCAWLLGFEFAYDVMIRSGGARDLGGILLVYGVIVAVIFVTVTIWSLSNRFRFRGLSRRKAARSVTGTEMAAHFAIDECTIETLRAAKLSRVAFDEHGRPEVTVEAG